MKRLQLTVVLASALCVSPVLAWSSGEIPPSPSQHLGFALGADRTLADYHQMVDYLQVLAEASPRVELQVLGETTLGEEMVMAVISSERNMANLGRIREIARLLADPRGLSDAEAESLVAEGKVVLLVTCNIHSTEIGASQMALEWAHALATASDAETLSRLDEVVLLLVPSLNPDGQLMVTDWYRKHLGTEYEGGAMPWLYHHYVGHDNNRDWFMLTQKETQAMTRAAYREWFPQVWLDEHQMGSTGPRMFVPPFTEPSDPDVHPLVWREINLIGSNMAFRLEQKARAGVIYGFAYDAYWPGDVAGTGFWKNVSGVLTEVASVALATPLEIAPGELSGGRKGLVEYGHQTNFPNPWPGGWWRLRDIMDYQRIASDATLEICAERREDFLRNLLTRARAAVAGFEPRQAFRIPSRQRDPAQALRLAGLLQQHGVEVELGHNGDIWVPLAQPYGRFVEEMLDTQRYPEVKLVPGDDVVRPYDVSAWTLPLMMGVRVERAALPEALGAFVMPDATLGTDGQVFALEPGSSEAARLINAGLRSKGRLQIIHSPTQLANTTWPSGTVFFDHQAAVAAAKEARPGVSWTAVDQMPPQAKTMSTPRVGLYKPWRASMDEGWTRFVLDQYGFEPISLDNQTVQKGSLGDSLDVIILPDVAKDIIADGKSKPGTGRRWYSPEMPPQYRGGLDKSGAQALVQFVETGGTLVSLGSSYEYVLEHFALPVRNTLAKTPRQQFSSAGALLQVQMQPHPVTYGMPDKTPVFLDEAIAFQTTHPGAALHRWILARYPDDHRDIPLSGWIHGAEKLERRAAAVATTWKKGKIVLFGFKPQHRAQTPVTFPMLFNSIYWSTSR